MFTLHRTIRIVRPLARLCRSLASSANTAPTSRDTKAKVSSDSSLPFDRNHVSMYTRSPNPNWSWCQKIDSTSEGQEWMEGEKLGWKTIVTAEEDPTKLYALMISGIIPRPIAFVSTVSEDGIENLAPFSWFGMVSHRPPIIAFSCLDASPDGRLKDTTRNATTVDRLSKSGFVVSIISEAFIEQANATSIDAPPDVSEWVLSGLTKLPSVHVKAPRIKESAFSMECELHSVVPLVDPTTDTRTTSLVLAHVKCIHVRRDVLTQRGTVDLAKFKPVSRLGDNAYARVGDAYKLPRPSWAVDGEAVREAVNRISGSSSE